MGQTSMVAGRDSELRPDTQLAVRVKELGKRYKKTIAVRDVSFEVRRGEIFGLIGPDGSGKSSVIRAVAGVQTYDSGSVEVFGQLVDSERSAEKVKDRLGLMPQGLGNNLYGQLSIDENVDYFAGLRLVPRRLLVARKERLLSMTRLLTFRDRPMRKLSGGMKQKLGLVCTLIHEPELVFLDEPTTGVDPVSRRDFWAILTELVKERGITAIVSTAYMDEAAYTDRLALFMDGRIVSQGSVDDIESLVSGTVVSFPSANPVDALDRLKPQFPHTQTLGNVVRAFVAEVESVALEQIAASAHVNATELTASSPDLEDVLACLLVRERTINGVSVSSEGNKDSPRPAEQPRAEQNGMDRDVPVKAHELVQDFGEFRAVDHVSFQVASGRIFGLLGANGAGKTTVIKMLTGLLPPTSGTGSVAGADMNRAGQEIKKRIGYMSQSFALYLDMTVIENLEFYAGVYGLFPRQRQKRIASVLQMTGMQGNERRITGDLPMGVRQRLALGCALVHQPRVIFLDEPTSGVDVLGRRQFWEILVRLAREEGVSILVTTHYMSEAEHCDDLALMYAGRIVARGSPVELRNKLEELAGVPLCLQTSNPLGALRIAKQNGFANAALFGRSLRILTSTPDKDERMLRMLLAENKIATDRTEHESITMEDVFVHSVLSEEANARNQMIETIVKDVGGLQGETP